MNSGKSVLNALEIEGVISLIYRPGSFLWTFLLFWLFYFIKKKLLSSWCVVYCARHHVFLTSTISTHVSSASGTHGGDVTTVFNPTHS